MRRLACRWLLHAQQKPAEDARGDGIQSGMRAKLIEEALVHLIPIPSHVQLLFARPRLWAMRTSLSNRQHMHPSLAKVSKFKFQVW